MKKIKILILISFLFFTPIVFASEFTGVLTTGVSTGLEGTVVTLPSASPVAGVYTSAQSVSLTTTGAQSIHYTVDGSVPSCTTGNTYSTTISVSESKVIQALSCYPNSQNSGVANFAYAINPPTPPSSGGGGGGGGGGGIISSPVGGYVIEDTNKDHKVDLLDFNTLMVHWGETGTGNIADFNLDGKVDILDFNLLMVNWIV